MCHKLFSKNTFPKSYREKDILIRSIIFYYDKSKKNIAINISLFLNKYIYLSALLKVLCFFEIE